MLGSQEAASMDRARASALSRQIMLDFMQMRSFVEDPLVIERAEGVRVWDAEGKSYIDGLSGIFVVNMGHNRPEIVQAVAEQLGKVAFAPQMATSPPELELGELMVRITPPRYTQVKFFSGGSEATEGAIKMARQYHRQTGNPGKYKILTHYRGYHGATGHAMAATGWARYRSPFEPLAPGFVKMHTPDSYHPLVPAPPAELGAAYARLVEEQVVQEGPETVAAIMTEPIMMSAGVIVPPTDYLPALREIADRHDVLLIFDEVITGFGRTGTLFCMEHSGVEPDVFCCGKGMSGGYAPLSGLVISQKVADAFWGDPEALVQFHAGHTYGGNPVACAAGLAAIKVLLEAGVLESGRRAGAYAKGRLQELARRHPTVGDVRGEGMLLGIELVKERRSRERFGDEVAFGNRVQAAARRRGLLLRASPWFTAVAPPLTTTEAEVDELVDRLDAALEEAEASVGLVAAASRR
jgi:adenosylmethionine-8-amino-7-oxononanoate aminotransferase